ncbi:sodium-dependent transporter [Alkalibaculum sp. M08DMB]|uniref:Transporter n=1 Tax=Alkalibaculum sporogenes TaxID=2655001 RepID=A0A6A7K4U2_9FIRM|nr:sodium-dependent transporter [Alkalibaculum sporogenes]MPW24479.1 sodium-dependent transporter [Alkalibaculum sporogenes]
MNERSEFSNKIGFVLAAAGSAVGLGNIWRFPYLAAKYGGGLFVLIYIFFVLTFGFTIMMTEIVLGRKTRLSPIGAYKAINKKYSFIGIIAVVVAGLILPYYSVIGGWVIKYFVTFITGGYISATNDNFFIDFISSPVEPIIWQIIFVLMTAIVVLRGVKDGIEKANKVLMPTLIILTLGVGIYSMSLPGAIEGLKYYLIPDFSRFSIEGVLAALGQMFYSLSLSMGIMITYGSYLKQNDDIEKSVRQIEIFDSGIAILAGFMIVPAVFAFSGGNEQALSAGPGLMFITLPKVFHSMGLSTIVGSAFFLLVLLAAVTSAISLMEAVVSSLCDKYKIARNKAVALTTVFMIVMGVPSSLGNGIWSNFKILNLNFLDLMDFITNAVLMPIGALLTCIFIGFVVGTKVISDEVKLSSDFKKEKMFNIMIKYIAPIFIIAILLSSILSTFGIIAI